MHRSIGKSALIMLVLFCVACQENPTESGSKETKAKQKQENGEEGQHEGEGHANEITIAPTLVIDER